MEHALQASGPRFIPSRPLVMRGLRGCGCWVQALVYELMARGSLDEHLAAKASGGEGPGAHLCGGHVHCAVRVDRQARGGQKKMRVWAQGCGEVASGCSTSVQPPKSAVLSSWQRRPARSGLPV